MSPNVFFACLHHPRLVSPFLFSPARSKQKEKSHQKTRTGEEKKEERTKGEVNGNKRTRRHTGHHTHTTTRRHTKTTGNFEKNEYRSMYIYVYTSFIKNQEMKY
jgi:hypothetical protein